MPVALLQPCVDLARTFPSAAHVWRGANKHKWQPIDTTGVSPSLDRLRDAHAGAGEGGDSSLLRDAPPEVAAFGAIYGISCGLVWGHM